MADISPDVAQLQHLQKHLIQLQEQPMCSTDLDIFEDLSHRAERACIEVAERIIKAFPLCSHGA